MAFRIPTTTSASNANGAASSGNDQVSLRMDWKGPKKEADGRWIGVLDLTYQDAPSPITVHIPENAGSPAVLPFKTQITKSPIYSQPVEFPVLLMAVAKVKTLQIKAGIFKEYENRSVMISDLSGRCTYEKRVSRDDVNVDVEFAEEPQAGQEYQIVLTGESWLSLKAKVVKKQSAQAEKAAEKPQEKKEEKENGVAKLASGVEKLQLNPPTEIQDDARVYAQRLRPILFEAMGQMTSQFKKAISAEIKKGTITWVAEASNPDSHILEEFNKIPPDTYRALKSKENSLRVGLMVAHLDHRGVVGKRKMIGLEIVKICSQTLLSQENLKNMMINQLKPMVLMGTVPFEKGMSGQMISVFANETCQAFAEGVMNAIREQ